MGRDKSLHKSQNGQHASNLTHPAESVKGREVCLGGNTTLACLPSSWVGGRKGNMDLRGEEEMCP